MNGYSSEEQVDNGRDESKVSKCGYLAWKRPEEADDKEQEDEIVRELIIRFEPLGPPLHIVYKAHRESCTCPLTRITEDVVCSCTNINVQ